MIRGITFSEQSFYSADFAHYQNFFLNRQNGITKGCEITHDNESVTIGTGYFIAHGRLLNVEDPETIEKTGFSDGYNRIVYEIDLAKENTIEEFRQGAIKVLHTEELIQEDLDNDGKVYQMPFCHFQWSETKIKGLVIDVSTLVLDNIFADISDNFDAINQMFSEWFSQQKQKIEDKISDLEAQGFERLPVYQKTVLTTSKWDTATKTYNFEEDYPAEVYNLNVEPIDCTPEQAKIWGGIMPMGSSTLNVLTALGDVPAVDIPVLLTIRRKQGE